MCADGILVDVTYIKTRGGIRQMTEEKEFLKEHPSFVQDIIYPFQNGKGFIDLKAIHETQLDKAKVLEDITELQEHKHIEEDSDTLYECEICGKEFDDEDNAETHEQEHSEYQEFQDQLKLAEAAEYPEQKKLIEVK